MSMKIPSSERIRQLLEGYLQGGYQQSEQPASDFLKLVFATLWQASERWQRVRMTDLELAMLRRLRRELELSPSSPEPTSFQRKAV